MDFSDPKSMELSFIRFGKVKGIVETFIIVNYQHPIFSGFFLILLNNILFEEGL